MFISLPLRACQGRLPTECTRAVHSLTKSFFCFSDFFSSAVFGHRRGVHGVFQGGKKHHQKLVLPQKRSKAMFLKFGACGPLDAVGSRNSRRRGKSWTKPTGNLHMNGEAYAALDLASREKNKNIVKTTKKQQKQFLTQKNLKRKKNKRK